MKLLGIRVTNRNKFRFDTRMLKFLKLEINASVYQVNDLSLQGLSFMIPNDIAYQNNCLQVDQKIKAKLFIQENQENQENGVEIDLKLLRLEATRGSAIVVTNLKEYQHFVEKYLSFLIPTPSC